MNNACIIAACAASKRNQNANRYTQYLSSDNSIYYRVNFRMYIHFNPITIVYPCEKGYLGSIYAPYETTFIRPAYIDGQTLWQQHTYSVNSKNAKPNIDTYIENNIERYTNSAMWRFTKQEIIDKYLDDIKKKYNVILDESSLDYSIQYVWEVESIE